MNDFEVFWTIYEEAFPPDERRDRSTHLKIMENKNYYVKPFYVDTKMVGFITYWELGEFLFIEHLAVDKEERGGGYGGKIMAQLILTYSHLNFVLEVEPPVDEISKKRIKFYENIGFQLNSFDYLQPAYGKDKEPVEMMLMSYPKLIEEGQETELVKIIYRKVYYGD